MLKSFWKCFTQSPELGIYLKMSVLRSEDTIRETLLGYMLDELHISEAEVPRHSRKMFNLTVIN
jgi:hypothetical protein